jgi:hypothetical protein
MGRQLPFWRTYMRTLNEKDNEILRKLAPEASIPTHYRSILPPVSMHFAADDEDLQDRLKRLSTEDQVSGRPHPGRLRVLAVHLPGGCRDVFRLVGGESVWRYCEEDKRTAQFGHRI